MLKTTSIFLLSLLICTAIQAAEQPPHVGSAKVTIEQLLPKDGNSGNALVNFRYSGNVKTLKFHQPGCKHYNCRTCTRFFKSEDEAVNAGFDRCGWCFK